MVHRKAGARAPQAFQKAGTAMTAKLMFAKQGEKPEMTHKPNETTRRLVVALASVGTQEDRIAMRE